MLNQLCILSVVQNYTCITEFIWPLHELEYVTLLQRFFFLENASLAKIEFVKMKPKKWKTRKAKRDCKWFSVWATCTNIMTNSLLCSALILQRGFEKAPHAANSIPFARSTQAFVTQESQCNCSAGEQSRCLSPQISGSRDRRRCKPYRPSRQESNTIFHQ